GRPPLDPADRVEVPILSTRAASRALSPSWTIATARALRSFEYPLAIVPPRRCRRGHWRLCRQATAFQSVRRGRAETDPSCALAHPEWKYLRLHCDKGR